MPFLTRLDVEYRREVPKYKWLVKQPFIYQSKVLADEGFSKLVPLVIDAGFSTDFASVPRIPFAYWLAGGIAQEAAVVHDYLYYIQIVPREICDRVFLEAMEETEIAAWRRYPMYWAVKLFGGKAYDRKTSQR